MLIHFCSVNLLAYVFCFKLRIYSGAVSVSSCFISIALIAVLIGINATLRHRR